MQNGSSLTNNCLSNFETQSVQHKIFHETSFIYHLLAELIYSFATVPYDEKERGENFSERIEQRCISLYLALNIALSHISMFPSPSPKCPTGAAYS